MFGKIEYIKAHCRTKIKRQNKRKGINCISLEEVGHVTNKTFVKLKFRNTNVKIQLDTGRDITIINGKTWNFVDKPKLIKLTKVAYVTRNILYSFGKFVCSVTFRGQTKKTKTYVLKILLNLFGTVGWKTLK